MKINLRKFQEGGEMAPETQTQEPATKDQGQDPIMQIAQMAAQALQNQDCESAMAVCQAFVQLIQQSGEQAPAQEPVYRKGGKLVKRV